MQVKQDIDADGNEGCLSISLEFRFGVEMHQFVHREFSAQEVWAAGTNGDWKQESSPGLLQSVELQKLKIV